MSRERKQRRDKSRQESNSLVIIANFLAAKEHRVMASQNHLCAYIIDLFRRRVLIDRGPHPMKKGRLVSVIFDRLKPGSDDCTLDELDALFQNVA